MNKNILYKKINSSIDELSNFNEIDLALSDIDKDNYPEEINILHEICLLHIAINDKQSPYGDNIVEIAKDNRDLLVACLDNLNNPLIKGRIADILWVTKKVTHIKNPIQYAQKSIENFNKITLSNENYLDVLKCYQRALILSTQTKQIIDKDYITSQLNDAINSKYEVSAPFYQYSSAQILLLFDLPINFNQLADILISIGEDRCSQFGIILGTIEYLELAVDACIKAKNKAKETSLLKKIANIYSEEADNREQGLHARMLYEKALETIRKIPTSERDASITEIINSVETKIYNIGSTIINQMNVVSSGSIDITKYQENAMRYMSNIQNTKDALIKFSQIGATFSYRYIKEQCIKTNKNSFLQATCIIQSIAHDGRSVGALPKFDENDTEVLEIYMVGHFNQYFLPILNQACIVPSFHQLSTDHKVKLDELKQICQSSYIVPQDRIELISKGLHFGFQEDFQTAIYLLSPQIENIIRQLLKAMGISTTHSDRNHNQTESGLSSLLDSPDIQSILYEDILFMLKALFTSQLGPNLRNNVAHGLFNDQESYSQEVIYAWWFIFRWIMKTQKEDCTNI